MSRKMVKWAPFVSLKEQTIYLAKLRQERLKVERPTLSDDEIAAINQVLVDYHGQELTFTYYDKGLIKTFKAVIIKIDQYTKKVVTSDLTINLDDLLSLDD